jgi:hypothetical protein
MHNGLKRPNFKEQTMTYMVAGSNPGCGKRLLSSPERPDRLWGSAGVLFNWCWRSFPGINRPGRDAGQSLPPCPPPPTYTPPWRGETPLPFTWLFYMQNYPFVVRDMVAVLVNITKHFTVSRSCRHVAPCNLVEAYRRFGDTSLRHNVKWIKIIIHLHLLWR